MLLLPLCLLCMVLPAQAANTYHVATSGDDLASGAPESPLKTIQKALDRVVAGDSLVVHGGVYPVTSAIVPKVSGAPGKWITVMAAPGAEVWIDGSDYFTNTAGKPLSGSREAVLQIQGVSHYRFQDIGVRKSHTVGIIVNGPGTSTIDLIRCKSMQSYGSGISVWYADQVRVLGCEIVGANDQNLRSPGVALKKEAPHEALSICGARHFEVAYNHVHHCQKEGIDVKEVSAHGTVHHNYVHDLPRQGLYVDCWFGLLEDVEFHHNVVHACAFGAALSGEGAKASMRNVRFHHNLLYQNRGSGLAFGIWGKDMLRTDIAIYNNTIVGNGSADHYHKPTGGIDVRSSNLERVAIYNNLCLNNFAYEIATFDPDCNRSGALDAKAILIEHNFIGRFKSLTGGSLRFKTVYGYSGRNFLEGDPGLVDPVNGDFRLKADSPCIGAGRPGPQGQRNDLGAIPYGETLLPHLQPPNDFPARTDTYP